MAEAKRARRMALVAAAGGVEPLGTGSPCADCGAPRTALNTGVCWSDTAKTRLTFHSAACDACRSARACKRLREDPAAKLVQMGADAAARTKRPRYEGAPLAAATCTARIGALLEAQGGRCASCAHDVVLAAGSGIFMASLDRVGGAGYDDGSAQVLCLGCQRFFNDLDAAARAELTRAVVANAREPRPNHPLAALPVEFERSVSAKLRQMKQREVATDRPSRGAPVELDRAAASRRLCHWGLRCACAPGAHPKTTLVSPPHTRRRPRLAPTIPRIQASATNVPLSSEPNSAFTWSFDRVVAGEAYAEETVQPVLHRYNDAKYIWSDTSAREWLDGFVRAHDPTVPQAERRVVVGARARGALDGAHGPAPMRRIVIDLELEEGAEAARPILLD